ILPGLKLPGWTVTFVIALVVLGFPVSVVMAWLFDLGPRGVERTPPEPPRVTPAADNAASTITDAVSMPSPSREISKPATKPETDRRTIAVLPFVNMSGDPDNEYFSDGISEEILNLLCKLPQLKVASRTSSFAFKGKEASIPAVASELNVGTVLEGSVRRAGERVRITAQLIDAGSDSHLWSETYDREMKDVFAIQDDIAHSIADALQMTLSPQERRAIQSVATANPEAYDFYLRGRKYMYSMARHDYAHAIRMFEQAIKIDSKYALAYAGMADAYSQMYRYIEATPQSLQHAVRASEQAVALDPDSAEAHAARGLALVIGELYEEADREFEAAIVLNPHLFEAWFYYGLACTSQARYEKAIELYIKASEINPVDYQSLIFLAQAYASLGRKQDEMRVRLGILGTLERHIRLNPHDTRALYISAQNFWHVGEHKRASELTEQALGQGQDEPMVLYNVACLYTTQGNHERAIELLDKAVDKGFGDRAWIEHDSDLDPLHGDPRFQALLTRIH
ncbi:MAG: TPR end-of-group domain-containing protein, partial [Rhodanobacteraceae bacterium]